MASTSLSLTGLVCVLAAGCYAPSPPDGAYLCSTGDQACPSGQHCTCGQCVKNDSSAACGFNVTVSDNLAVDEHEEFPVQIQALAMGGAPASTFNGTVKLSSSWGDVTPDTVQLANGTASAVVQLNRETLSGVAVVSATAAGNTGKSDGIVVHAPCTACMTKFAVDANEILPGPGQAGFGWTHDFAAEPSIVKTGSIYNMYFLGLGGAKYGFGLATSTDGKTFSPLPDPVLQGNPMQTILYSPTVFPGGPGQYMAYGAGDSILLASSTDGKSFSPVNAGAPILKPVPGSYFELSLTFPQVLPDPSGDGSQVMFFSAFTQNSTGIGRASSPDGLTWTPEPAPLLSSSLSGEQILISPRVMLDGTVWKMWYSYANLADLPNCLSGCPSGSTCNITTGSCTPTDSGDVFFQFCQARTRIQIGYATSADGFYWTKSTRNPAISLEEVPGLPRAIIVSSALPTDGVNASNGISVWFSPFRTVLTATTNRCVPNGIRRATRP
jgi:hypothetical protein